MLTLLLFACLGSSEDPCLDYCGAVCDCSSEAECDDCYAVYEDADADLQDSCETALAEGDFCPTE